MRWSGESTAGVMKEAEMLKMIPSEMLSWEVSAKINGMKSSRG